MRSLKIMIPALLLATVLPGCSRIRQMTRRDYASMEDPFTSRLTDDEAVASRDEQGKTTNPEEAFRTASQTKEKTGYDNRFAGALGLDKTQAPATGPSLSDFVGTADNKVAEARATAASFGTSAKQSVETDMAGMTQFLGEQATASGLTETAAELDKDFAEWATSQKQQWASKAAAVDEQASPFMNAANAARHSFAQSPSALASAAFNETLGGEFGETEVATPFIQQASGQRFTDVSNKASSAGFAPPTNQPHIQPRSPVGAPNPFDQLMGGNLPAGSPPAASFGSETAEAGRFSLDSSADPAEPEWDVTPVAPHQSTATDPFISPGGSTARPKSLDSNFSFDTGWKPSDVVPR